MYAIIVTGGKQYKVSEGDVIDVEKLEVEEGKQVTFDQVIAVSDGTLRVASEVAGAKVNATVVKQGKSAKVTVYRYKPKTGFHDIGGYLSDKRGHIYRI